MGGDHSAGGVATIWTLVVSGKVIKNLLYAGQLLHRLLAGSDLTAQVIQPAKLKRFLNAFGDLCTAGDIRALGHITEGLNGSGSIHFVSLLPLPIIVFPFPRRTWLGPWMPAEAVFEAEATSSSIFFNVPFLLLLLLMAPQLLAAKPGILLPLESFSILHHCLVHGNQFLLLDISIIVILS